MIVTVDAAEIIGPHDASSTAASAAADLSHAAFFGDRERTFKLPASLWPELERVTGAGLGALCQRVFRSEFRASDITEILRLALIGGGEKPETAAALVANYVPARPLIESYSLAV